MRGYIFTLELRTFVLNFSRLRYVLFTVSIHFFKITFLFRDGSDFDDETSDDAKSVRTTDNNKK